MTRVLVTGGTGTLGRLVVQRLAAGGADVRVLTRGSRTSSPLPDSVELVVGDLRTGAGLAQGVAGVDAVVHCASDGRSARAVDVEGTRRLVEAAAAHGSPHLVDVSIVGVDRIPLGYYRAKLAAEQIVERSGLPFTVQRATQFPSLVMGMFSAQVRAPLLPVVVPRGFAFQPVDPSEVADRLVTHLDAGPAGRAPDLGGPQVLAVEDLARRWLQATGRRRAVLRAPVPGRIGAAFRDGANLCPDQAVGVRSWDEALAALAG